jgi:hypothetical protein
VIIQNCTVHAFPNLFLSLYEVWGPQWLVMQLQCSGMWCHVGSFFLSLLGTRIVLGRNQNYFFLIFNCCMCLFWSKVVSAVKQVGIAQTVYWQVTGWVVWVRFPAVQDFSILHSIQTGSGAQPASYPMGSRGSFPRVKWQGCEADHSPPFSAKVKNGEPYLHFPICLHGMVLN